MEKVSNRRTRVAAEIKKILSEFLLKKTIFDPESEINTSLISITDVIMSSCLQHAKVFAVSIAKNVSNEDCITFLEKHKSKLRNYLGSSIRMKYIPDLKFFVDDSFENAERISTILEKIKLEKIKIV